MKILYYILHTFTGCKDEYLKSYRNSACECEKCGRITFIFETNR